LIAQADDNSTQPDDILADIHVSTMHPLSPDAITFGSELASLADPSTLAPPPPPLLPFVISSNRDIATAQDVMVVGCSSNASLIDTDDCRLYMDTAIEHGDISGVNDEGKEELDGIDFILLPIMRNAVCALDVSCRSYCSG
jgi:hypothetical protein